MICNSQSITLNDLPFPFLTIVILKLSIKPLLITIFAYFRLNLLLRDIYWRTLEVLLLLTHFDFLLYYFIGLGTLGVSINSGPMIRTVALGSKTNIAGLVTK